MSNPLADPNYVREQYRASANLDARVALHARFSTAPRDFHAWVFDHFDLPADARVLEVGCGTGLLWQKNRARIPATWRVTLADFSRGMVETTRATGVAANFAQADAQALPWRAASFDAVIANHMLYHVPDQTRALAEFARVLTPGGKVFAATNGASHLRELREWLAGLLGAEATPLLAADPARNFSLENGAAQLANFFARVTRFDFADALVVTEVEPLVAYVLSGTMRRALTDEKQNALRQAATERIARDGAFRITKAAGLFVAEK